MKNSLLLLYLLVCTSFFPDTKQNSVILSLSSASENLFIIITDGFRWQEVFNGADSLLINDEICTPDTATMKSMYWADTKEERRKKLMPFFWNVISKKGQMYGNRDFNNKVDVANLYSVSYPGYNEIFTGTTDISISGNSKKKNPNINVLEYLNKIEEFTGKIAVFSSWNVFPYILNKDRNNLMMNSGYQSMENEEDDPVYKLINKVQDESVEYKSATRYDQLTYTTAREYIKNKLPRVVLLGLGETDDFAHQKRYDLYLQQANQVDKMIADLWHMIQTTPAYKNKTSILVTTDHGRGRNQNHWSGHGFFIGGSSQTWFTLIGPGIEPLGEMKNKKQVYQKQMAETIANLVGEEFDRSNTNHFVYNSK